MESVRVRGCVVRTSRPANGKAGTERRLADASRRQNGPRKAVPRSWIDGGRSRCGLEVSPASPASSDMAQGGRRVVVASLVTDKLRTPQQAVVGSKTRSAG